MRIAHELAGIRQALERIAAVLEPLAAPPAPPPVEDVRCLHPQDERIDFGWTGGVEDFECRRCGFRSVPREN